MAKDGLCAIDEDLKNATWEDDDDDESKIPDDTIHLGSATQCQYGEPTTSPLLLLLPAQVWSLMAHPGLVTDGTLMLTNMNFTPTIPSAMHNSGQTLSSN